MLTLPRYAQDTLGPLVFRAPLQSGTFAVTQLEEKRSKQSREDWSFLRVMGVDPDFELRAASSCFGVPSSSPIPGLSPSLSF